MTVFGWWLLTNCLKRELYEVFKRKPGKDALLVKYTSGGTTPGDAYLWLLDEDFIPKSYKMFVPSMKMEGTPATWGPMDHHRKRYTFTNESFFWWGKKIKYGRSKSNNIMNTKIISNGILRALSILVGIACFLFFLYKIQSVIIYVIIAGILSLITGPITLFLRRRLKFPNTLSVISTMLFMLTLVSGLIGMFIPLITEQGESLSLLQIDGLQQNIQSIFNQINAYFSAKGIDVLSELKNIDLISQFKEIPNFLNAIVGTVGSFSVGLFSVLFISFFLMKDRKILKNGILLLVPNKTKGRFTDSLEKINNLLSRYFIGLIFQISILFILYTIILLIFDINNAVVIAFLCALLNLIPYVGPLIGAVIMFILSMTSNIGQDFQTVILPTTSYVMIGYLIAQLVDNFASQPIIFSKTTKSHPLEIFLIIIIGGLLFGIIGMITAVPLYTALKVILKEFLSENKIVKTLTKDL